MATSVELSQKDEQLLEQLAEATGQTKAELLRQLVDIAVEELEHFYSAVEIAKKVEAGEEEVFTSEQVRASLGLAD